MAKQCTVCAHASAVNINEQLITGVPLDRLAKAHGLTISSLQRHKKHIPSQLSKAQGARETAAADSLMVRVSAGILREKTT